MSLAQVVGCAASGKQFQPEPIPPGKGIIYIYRSGAEAGATIPVFVDGKRAGGLAGDGYLYLFAEPGPRTVMAGENKATVIMQVESGSPVYVELEPRIGWVQQGAALYERSEAVADSTIRRTRYSGR